MFLAQIGFARLNTKPQNPFSNCFHLRDAGYAPSSFQSSFTIANSTLNPHTNPPFIHITFWSEEEAVAAARKALNFVKVSSSSMFFVAEAVAQILGTAEKIIKSGSTLQLHCILKRATEEPLYVFW